MSYKRKLCLLVMIVLTISTFSQKVVKYTFDDGNTNWNVESGKVEILTEGAYRGKALRLDPNTIVSFPLYLSAQSTYKLTAQMRTESGMDHVTMQLANLGKGNISVSTALAAWSKIERTFNVSTDFKDAKLELIFDDNPNRTCAWIDEITIERISGYQEASHVGIPMPTERRVKEDMGVTMQPDDKIRWMLDDKLGMFIHWGLYAGPAKGEWYMENKGIPIDQYRKLAYPESGDSYFDAKEFNADKWVTLAKKAGMRYMNMVTQHHDGYALFESKYLNAFTSKQTHNRDFVKEYVEACRKQKMKVGLYKTLINWRFPGYYDVTGKNCNSNKFGYTTDSSHKENARLMKEELYCQVKELMTNYGQIDQLFWDGGWLGQKGSDADGAYFWESGKYMDAQNDWPINSYFQDKDKVTGKALGLMGIVRKYQPNIVVNPRSGWCGDYSCEEGSGAVKGPIRTGVVEKCISLSPGWGYNRLMEDSTHVMALHKIKRLCADCMVRNMCFLVNVGPDRHGSIPKYTEQRLLEFGKWIDKVGPAIYGTRGGPWEPVDGEYGFTYTNNMIYIYFLGGYQADTFTLPSIPKGIRVVKVYNLGTAENVKFGRRKKNIELKNLSLAKDDITIIAVELNKKIGIE